MEKFDCLHFILGKALQQVKQTSKAKLAPYGVTPVQFGLLYFLWKKDGQLGSELRERLQMDSATVTGIIDRLEQGGFIERRFNHSDRRYRLIFLTEKGKSLEQPLCEKMDELDKEILPDLDEEGIQQFKHILFDIGLKEGTKAGITE
ncbi:MarR family winged helix-turn-helix transcriptional regulator [Salicibibacter kimchii]|uniref:MarR family transcriptional regulator n=1 Tax=Salicibibacter kimchii TaxID=2099786 RepID=A0A345BWK2_9BACI|nr:MarR family transcriptional regulator [Salicibibacter kimchii]AXF55333.1 MarR family transcriptional regulator [Salicibibacter kimchii]